MKNDSLFPRSMEMFAFASAVHGYHVYQHVVKPPIGEKPYSL